MRYQSMLPDEFGKLFTRALEEDKQKKEAEATSKGHQQLQAMIGRCSWPKK